ncbi:hypothetical protein KI387_036818, partial [Taxus chinensis]
IAATLAHSGEKDELIDQESDSREDARDEIEEDLVGEDLEDEGFGVGNGEVDQAKEEESDPEWHDSQDM